MKLDFKQTVIIVVGVLLVGVAAFWMGKSSNETAYGYPSVEIADGIDGKVILSAPVIYIDHRNGFWTRLQWVPSDASSGYTLFNKVMRNDSLVADSTRIMDSLKQAFADSTALADSLAKDAGQ